MSGFSPHGAWRDARVALADLPTPVRALGKGPGWIKQDEVTHPLYGGNKLRKLEFIVGEWRARGIDEVVSFGAIGTNAGVATSLMCHLERIACRVLLFDQPMTAAVRANLLAMQQLGARLTYCGSLARAYLWFMAHPRRLRRGSYFLFAGCSNPPATLAYVHAALELRAQIAAGLLPVPAEIVVPVGSGSTLAGLTLGCAMAGLATRVTGVRVVPDRVLGVESCTPGTVLAQMRSAAVAVGWLGELPMPHIVGDYFGTGYGEATAAAAAAIARFAGDYGVTLEGTYGGKAAAYFLHRMDDGVGPLLFWNSFNARPLGLLPRAAVTHALPKAVARKLAGVAA